MFLLPELGENLCSSHSHAFCADSSQWGMIGSRTPLLKVVAFIPSMLKMYPGLPKFTKHWFIFVLWGWMTFVRYKLEVHAHISPLVNSRKIGEANTIKYWKDKETKQNQGNSIVVTYTLWVFGQLLMWLCGFRSLQANMEWLVTIEDVILEELC